MTGTITWMTGFNRNLPFNSVDISGYSDANFFANARDTVNKRTGLASLQLWTQTTWAAWVRRRIIGSPTNPSVSVAIYPRGYFNSSDSSQFPKLYLRYGASTYVELRWNYDSHTMDLYIGGSKVASGGIEVSQNTWFHLQWKIDPDADTIQVKIDGHLSIDYTSYTQEYEYDYCYLLGGKYALQGVPTICNFDDWCIGYGDWFGDVRIDSLVPDGDSTVQWDRSAEDANYKTIDETPESDTDYNFTKVDGEYDKIDVEDWDDYDEVLDVYKEPIAVMAWVRSKVDVATGEFIAVGVDSAGTVDTTQHALAYAYEFYEHIMQNNPADDAPWEDADIDAVELYYEAVLGA